MRPPVGVGCDRFDASPSPAGPTVDQGCSQSPPGERPGGLPKTRRGVAATTAASTGQPSGWVAVRAPAASVSVAPLVTTSSTRTSRPDGGPPRTANDPARLA